MQFNPGLKDSPPVLPVFWTDPDNGFKIHWHMATEHWTNFMAKINAYTDGNGKDRVAESEVENQICQQLPKWACNGETNFAFPPASVTTSGRQGCCGRRG
jgi:hypothetical protein